jgi:hypothetical protein
MNHGAFAECCWIWPTCFGWPTKSRRALVAKNLFLRKQLAMFQERNNKPHRAQDSARWLMARLSRLLIGGALVVVRPDTLIRWHRRGFRLFWRWKSMATGMTTFRRGPFVKAAISAAEPPRLWPNRLTSLTRCSALEWC